MTKGMLKDTKGSVKLKTEIEIRCGTWSKHLELESVNCIFKTSLKFTIIVNG